MAELHLLYRRTHFVGLDFSFEILGGFGASDLDVLAL